MQITIACTRIPVDATQRGELEKLFGSKSFLLLKEMVASRCIERQVQAMNANLYGDTSETAQEVVAARTIEANRLAHLLDVLDDLGKSEQEWFTVTLVSNVA